MIHKHRAVSMRTFLRNPKENLPRSGETVFITRQTKAGPQPYALNLASFSTTPVMGSQGDSLVETPWGQAEVVMSENMQTGEVEIKMKKERYEELFGKIPEFQNKLEPGLSGGVSMHDHKKKE